MKIKIVEGDIKKTKLWRKRALVFFASLVISLGMGLLFGFNWIR